jgi:RNA polymerase sigma-70 factor (ECF subfamily)
VVGRPQEPESQLLERAKQGDHDAYAALVRPHEDIAFRTAWLLSGSAADAQDAAQDGLVKAWRALPRFRSGSSFRPWLLTIVANEARNRRRAAGRRAGLAVRAAARERLSGEAASSPEAAVLAAEERVALLGGLEALGDRDRDVLACRFLLDLDEAETAAALGCRRGTVKSRTSRALTRLRATLEAQG